MTQTKPDRLLKTRAVSFGPLTGWAGYLKMNAVCRARGHARTAGKPSDISSLLAAHRQTWRCGPIENSRARHVPGACLRVRACRQFVATSDGPDTEFISVRRQPCRAPMNRSLDWGGSVLHLGSVGSPT